MGASKWDIVKSKLPLIEAWCRDGLIETDICKKLGISVQTLNTYKKEHIELVESLKKGKEVIDYEVEQKLLKRAMGYDYEEVTKEPVYNTETKETTLEVTKRVTKHYVPDTTAQIFWLKNRKPKEWRDKRDIEMSGEMNVNNPFKDLTTEELKKLARCKDE